MNRPFIRDLTLFLSRNRFYPLTIIYGILLSLSVISAFLIGFDFSIPQANIQRGLEVSLWIIPLKLMILCFFGQYRGLMTYFRLPDLIQIFWASLTSLVIVTVLFFFGGFELSYPRRVILLDFVFSIVLLSLFRVFLRRIRERFLERTDQSRTQRKNVAIVGAGDFAAKITYELMSKRMFRKRPMVILDLGNNRINRSIHGVPVVSSDEDFRNLKKRYALTGIVLTTSTRSPRIIQEISTRAKKAGLEMQIVPEFDRFLRGEKYELQLRQVQIEDLLNRRQVDDLDWECIESLIVGKTILVTGAGGSIGSELCRQICRYRPKQLIIIDRCEIQLYQIEQELSEHGVKNYSAYVTDTADEESMKVIFDQTRPFIVFHAAAHKHVPIMERQPWEAIKNNSFATIKLAELANLFKVDRFVLVSTDKAINPTSVMGASKRLAEKLILSYSKNTQVQTKFCAVRFGNVMGSSGSVIPLFRKQIARGGPVTVTHPKVTRYFMTIPEAVGLVMQSATMIDDSEVFLLDMGEPVVISELAKKMISLSGFVPNRDIEIKYTGLRPGEKLFEELQLHYEEAAKTKHPQVFKLCRTLESTEPCANLMDAVLEMCGLHDVEKCKSILKTVVPEYTPSTGRENDSGKQDEDGVTILETSFH